MPSERFKVGDVVRLKSGGPDMTVTGVAIGGDLICRWFEGDTARIDTFPSGALIRPPERDTSTNRED
jgi:uncharacterized protein YodC (DUF2158 family)